MRLPLLTAAVLLLTSFFMLSHVEASAAEKKVVLQLSDASAEKQTLVLNVANNLIKHYGPDNVVVEVVAFGPGLRLLFKDNANKDRVQSLVVSGVEFAACQNTVKGMSKVLGHPPKLSSHAKPVPAGVARIIELHEKGYLLIRP